MKTAIKMQGTAQATHTTIPRLYGILSRRRIMVVSFTAQSSGDVLSFTLTISAPLAECQSVIDQVNKMYEVSSIAIVPLEIDPAK